jgi:rhomboid protease GluP
VNQQNPYPNPNPPAAYPPPQQQMVTVSMPHPTPYVVYSLLAVTIIAFLLQSLSTYVLGGDILFAYGAKINQYIMQGQVWRLITPVFLHASILHIASNMYGLFIFGPQLERSFGHWRFAALYFLAAFAGNVMSFLLTSSASLGSSTAVFGLVIAEAVFLYQNRKLLGNRIRGALSNILIIVVLNLGIGVTPGSGIDNWGHVGGILGGLVFTWFGGPLWILDGLPPAVKVVDTRESLHTQLAGFVVLAVFGGLALLRIVMK